MVAPVAETVRAAVTMAKWYVWYTGSFLSSDAVFAALYSDNIADTAINLVSVACVLFVVAWIGWRAVKMMLGWIAFPLQVLASSLAVLVAIVLAARFWVFVMPNSQATMEAVAADVSRSKYLTFLRGWV